MKLVPVLFRVSLAIASICCITSCGNKSSNNEPVIEADSIPIDTALSERLAKFAQAPRVKGRFAFYVFDLKANKPIFGYKESDAMPSASCLKLLTGVAGLNLLGSNFQYTSSLYIRGSIGNDGMLHGDAGLVAGTDPTFDVTEIQQFAKSLRTQGIKRISGRIFVDLAITEPIKSEEHWFPWDLSFSRYGILYKGEKRVAKALKSAMQAQGIATKDSQFVYSAMPRGGHRIAVHTSSLNPVLERMWKNSSNVFATSLLYTIGRHYMPQLPPAEAGLNYLRSFMRDSLSISDSTQAIHDGCGLCIYNRLSPQTLVAVLQFGYRHKVIYQALDEHLPIAGVNGTLAREMTHACTRGKIRAKTGTLSNPYGISTLAGYCQAANGHLLAFAIMASEMSVLDARVLQRKLGELLVKDDETKTIGKQS